MIGFSLGAYYALDLAASGPDLVRSVVLFFGTGGGDFSRSRAAYLGHFAQDDEFEPPEGVDALEQSLRRAGRPATFFRYRGAGHWLFEPNREAFHPQAAALAWDRTVSFLRETLAPPEP